MNPNFSEFGRGIVLAFRFSVVGVTKKIVLRGEIAVDTRGGDANR